MSDLTYPTPSSENRELAAANRRLTTAILGMTLLTGLVACLSYLAGRTVTHIRSESATVVRTEIPAPPVVVQPLDRPSAWAPPQAPPAKPAGPPLPAAGLYLQVGHMNPLVDRSMQDRLQQKGFPVILAPLENSVALRVLIGPIQSLAQQQEMSAKLAAEGFQFFPRRY